MWQKYAEEEIRSFHVFPNEFINNIVHVPTHLWRRCSAGAPNSAVNRFEHWPLPTTRGCCSQGEHSQQLLWNFLFFIISNDPSKVWDWCLTARPRCRSLFPRQTSPPAARERNLSVSGCGVPDSERVSSFTSGTEPSLSILFQRDSVWVSSVCWKSRIHRGKREI